VLSRVCDSLRAVARGARQTAATAASTDRPAHCNDPYAGSPTKTLLRLLLPRSDQVRLTFRLATLTAEAAGVPLAVREPH